MSIRWCILWWWYHSILPYWVMKIKSSSIRCISLNILRNMKILRLFTSSRKEVCLGLYRITRMSLISHCLELAMDWFLIAKLSLILDCSLGQLLLINLAAFQFYSRIRKMVFDSVWWLLMNLLVNFTILYLLKSTRWLHSTYLRHRLTKAATLLQSPTKGIYCFLKLMSLKLFRSEG